MPLPDLDLFAPTDAAELARRLHRRHLGHVFAAALLDPTGRCVAYAAFDEPWSDIHTVLAWAMATVGIDDRVTAVLLLSSCAHPREPSPHDRAVFELVHDQLADVGVELMGWWRTDGTVTDVLA